MAESRCNTLKDQLDLMKHSYGSKRSAAVNKLSLELEKSGSVILDENRISCASTDPPKSTVRQKSHQIGTDASGAAVRTINNIINGITNSVNRLVEIHSQGATPRANDQIGVVPRLDISDLAVSDNKRKANRRNKNLVARKSSVGVRKRVLSRFQSTRNTSTASKIVELYHNEAATRRSDSEICLRSKPNFDDKPSTCTYALPTVASKMKQVAKTYLHTFDMRTIPFCAAISTTQSHNIGINIQQVMSIVKNRQPIDGISPTLAHNIGLAADKLNTRPSDLDAKSTVRRASKCPLSRTRFDACALREQARELPEAIEEVDEGGAESPQTTSVFITGPSGDVEVKTKKTTTWKNPQVEQCTCAPDSDAIKYQQNLKTIALNQNCLIQSQIMESKSKKRLKRTKSNKNGKIQEEELPVYNREKDLKQVLGNLHSDFEQLNQKYECLCQKGLGDDDADALREIEKLEIELDKKEEEIGMVVTLCKEVQALKHQVKQLKEKRSNASLDNGKFKEYDHPGAAFHLTRLLQQIQHYQMRYKSNLGQDLDK